MDRGNAKLGLKLYDDAIKDYDKAISIFPNYAEAYNNRGCVKDDLGKYNEAIEDYKKAILLDPNNKDYKENLKMILGKIPQ